MPAAERDAGKRRNGVACQRPATPPDAGRSVMNTAPHLQLLVDALEVVHAGVEVAYLGQPELELLVEVGYLTLVSIALSTVLRLELALRFRWSAA